MQHVLVDLQ